MTFTKLLIFIPILSVFFSFQAVLPVSGQVPPSQDPPSQVPPSPDPTLPDPNTGAAQDLLLDGVVIYSSKAITMGANTFIYGDANIYSIEATTIGAASQASGDIVAGAAVTLGAASTVGGNIFAGAAVTLGAASTVGGNIFAGADVTIGASARAELTELQEILSEQVPLPEKLTATMTEDRTLLAGVYQAADLTTTAGITITFDGEGKDGHWVINAADYISFGAGIKMKLKNVTPESTITWNSKGYISIGAGTTSEDSEVLGTFYASNYISTGAEVTLKGIGNRCGGLYAANGYITLGAENMIGLIGCQVSQHSTVPGYFPSGQHTQ
jgi:hypothetical protein